MQVELYTADGIPTRENGKLNVEASWFNILRDVGRGGGGFVRVTADYSDFSDASMQNAVNAFSLPAFYEVHSVLIKHSLIVAGGALATYFIEAGITGDEDKFASPGLDILSTAVASDAFYYEASAYGPFDCENTTQIVLRATSTGANLDQATQGNFQAWFKISGVA